MSTTLLEGHVLSVVECLPAGHFHTVVTSPPYWQLRAYGTPPQTWPDGWVGELGQEPTPEAFVAHLVAVFEAVKRVLRDDGTLWVNLAGSYYSEPGGQNGGPASTLDGSHNRPGPKAVEANRMLGRAKKGQHPVYKPLDWVDVPGLFARAMQAAGWLWRSDVTWVKPSALPESISGTRWEKCKGEKVKAGETAPGYGGATKLADPTEQNNVGKVGKAEWADCPGCARCAQTEGLVLRRGSGRPTKSTERILVFAQKPGYYFDQEAVREPASADSHGGGRPGQQAEHTALLGAGHRNGVDGSTLTRPADPNGRNLRDWWVLGPEPLKDAHYAAFPSALPERCIKAGTSEWGCCPACGSPWARVVESRTRYVAYGDGRSEAENGKWTAEDRAKGRTSGNVNLKAGPVVDSTTLGWRPTCPPSCPGHGQPPVPARCLDPFGGSGTTALAANRLGRDCTLVELKPQYAALARKRVGREPLSLFATHGGEGGDDVGRGEGAAGGVERGASGDPGEPPPGLGGDEAPEAQGLTKQERHPNRTVAGFNQRWNASRRPVGDTGGILPVEERVEAQT